MVLPVDNFVAVSAFPFKAPLNVVAVITPVTFIDWEIKLVIFPDVLLRVGTVATPATLKDWDDRLVAVAIPKVLLPETIKDWVVEIPETFDDVMSAIPPITLVAVVVFPVIVSATIVLT